MAKPDRETPAVRLYTFPLDVTDDLRVRLSGWLDRDERKRSRGFVNRQLSDRFEAAHGVRRLLLARALGVGPGKLRFAAAAQGRPYLEAGGDSVLPDFNLSHSGALGALAVYAHGKIGADIEYIRVIDEADALAQTILSDAEIEIFRQTSLRRGVTPHETLLRLWVLKESLLKAAGCGLGIDPRAVRLDTTRLGAVLCGTCDTLTGVLPPRSGSDDRETRYQLRPFVVAGGVGALALATDDGAGLPPVVQIDLVEADLERMWHTLSGAQILGGGCR